MTLRELNILKDVLCVQDDDYTKPCISPEYLEHELEELFVMIGEEGSETR
jgi:hypothetical protein